MIFWDHANSNIIEIIKFRITSFTLADVSNILTDFKFSNSQDLFIHVDYIMVFGGLGP